MSILKRRLQEQKSGGKIAMVRKAMNVLAESGVLNETETAVMATLHTWLETRSYDVDTLDTLPALTTVAPWIVGLIMAANEKNRAEGSEAAFQAIINLARLTNRRCSDVQQEISISESILNVTI